MTAEEAITEHLKLNHLVFSNPTSNNSENDKYYRTVALRRFLEDLLESRGLPKDVEMSYFKGEKCKM